MTNWPSYSVAELQNDGVLLVEDGNHGEYRPRPSEFGSTGTAFIRAADLSDGQVRFEVAGHINQSALNRIRKGIGRPGDILFSHKGTVGKIAQVPPDAPPFVCSPQTTFWRVLDDSRLHRDYLYAFMRSRRFIDQWWARKGETDMADYVSLTAQRQLRITVPPLRMQSAIAVPLTALDRLLKNNRRRIEVLEQMAQVIYREWFVHFRYPGHEGVPLVDSPLGPIPEGWKTVGIGDIAAIQYGATLPRKDMGNGDVPVYGAAKVIGWHTETNVHEPTIIMGCRGTCGQVLLSDAPAFVTNNSFTIVPRIDHSKHWLLGFLKNRGVDEFVSGSAQPQITLTGISALDLIRPDSITLRSFDEAADALAQLIKNLQHISAGLAETRDQLLPKLVTGELDVSELHLDKLVESVA